MLTHFRTKYCDERGVNVAGRPSDGCTNDMEPTLGTKFPEIFPPDDIAAGFATRNNECCYYKQFVCALEKNDKPEVLHAFSFVLAEMIEGDERFKPSTPASLQCFLEKLFDTERQSALVEMDDAVGELVSCGYGTNLVARVKIGFDRVLNVNC